MSLRIGWLVALVLLVGCGKSDLPQLGTATGKVMRDGEPLPRVALEFRPTVGRSSSATTDEDGQFQLLYTIREKGAIVGDHVVYFRVPPTYGTAAKKKSKATPEERAAMAANAPEPVLIEYHEPVVMKPGANEFIFDLTGKK